MSSRTERKNEGTFGKFCCREKKKSLNTCKCLMRRQLTDQLLIRMQELGKIFRDARDSFGSKLAIESRYKTEPSEWWLQFGESATTLSKFAIRILSQTAASSGCERNWSTFQLIHSKVRNRLQYTKLEKYVYVYYNMRLREKNQRVDDEFCDPLDPVLAATDDDDPMTAWVETYEGITVEMDEIGAPPRPSSYLVQNAGIENIDDWIQTNIETQQGPRNSTGGIEAQEPPFVQPPPPRHRDDSEARRRSKGKRIAVVEEQSVGSSDDTDDGEYEETNTDDESSSSSSTQPSGTGGGETYVQETQYHDTQSPRDRRTRTLQDLEESQPLASYVSKKGKGKAKGSSTRQQVQDLDDVSSMMSHMSVQEEDSSSAGQQYRHSCYGFPQYQYGSDPYYGYGTDSSSYGYGEQQPQHDAIVNRAAHLITMEDTQSGSQMPPIGSQGPDLAVHRYLSDPYEIIQRHQQIWSDFYVQNGFTWGQYREYVYHMVGFLLPEPGSIYDPGRLSTWN